MTDTQFDTRDQKLRDLLTIRVVDFLERLEKPSEGDRMTFDEQKREAIANAKHLVEVLGEVCDESPATTADERRFLHDALNRIKAARALVLSILDFQDNPE